MQPVMRGPRISALDRISAMKRAYERVAEEIAGSKDPERRYTEATILAIELLALAKAAGALRAEAAQEMARREKLTHRELAKRLGISPTMADRLLKRGRQTETDTE